MHYFFDSARDLGGENATVTFSETGKLIEEPNNGRIEREVSSRVRSNTWARKVPYPARIGV